MWLGVLGPVRCVVDGPDVDVTGRLNRALLAALAVDRDRVTGINELVDALWRHRPPPAAEKVVRNRVSLLRALSTPAFIETSGGGYRLGREVAVDASMFEDAGRGVGERLRMWRGAPFEDVAEWPPARTAAIRLGELRAHLEEALVAEQLDLGVDPSALVGSAEQLVETEPFRERRWALLMRTLYLAGRQHDALRAFERARVLLRDELGLRPCSELLAAERSILDHEPSLRPHAGRAPPLVPVPVPAGLIGRDDDVTSVRALLAERRMVTLVGLGGVGKTSLAHELGTGFGGRCHVVDLSTLDDPDRVGETMARGLGIGVGPDPLHAIGGWASSAGRCLVVVDNCEHVREAVSGVIDAVLGAGDGARVLATSRIPLRHPAESVFHVRPLARADAITLYRLRADRRAIVSADEGTLHRLCQALSGVPLAIELAAARSSILSPADTLRDLATVISPGPGASRANRRVAADPDGVVGVVAWAVRALSSDALVLFRRCAVFPGGFTMDAARVLTDDLCDPNRLTDAVAELAEASLIEVRFDAGTRYHHLDLVRRRAEQLLDEAGERDSCQAAMVRWATAETGAITYGDLPRVLAELPNLVAAAEHACARADVDSALRITGASFVLVVAERGELLDSKLTAVQLPGADQHDRYLRSCAELAFGLFVLRGDLRGARHFAELVVRSDPGSRSAGWALHTLGHLEGDLDHERRALELAKRWRDPLLQFHASSVIVDNLGRSRADDAWELVLDNDRVAAEIDEPWAQIMTTLVRGMAYCQVDSEAALVHLGRAGHMADRCAMSIFSTVARALAGLAGADADAHTRLDLTRRGLTDAHRAGSAYAILLALARVARILSEMHRPERAAIFAGAARARFRSSTDRGTRMYQIDRDDHREHLAMFDLGATMDIPELVALLDGWIGEGAHE